VSPSSFRAARTTRAPLATNARAIASPMPRLAPVMTATFPERWMTGPLTASMSGMNPSSRVRVPLGSTGIK
jgi:hypothetical protein